MTQTVFESEARDLIPCWANILRHIIKCLRYNHKTTLCVANSNARRWDVDSRDIENSDVPTSI